MEFDYQWEKAITSLREVKSGQLFKRPRYPGIVYKCQSIDWARQRFFIEIHGFDEQLPLDFNDTIHTFAKKRWGNDLYVTPSF